MLGFEAINEIKKFSLATNTNVSDVILDRKFYILTSEKSFKGKKNDVTFLLYKIDDETYKIIHTWGSLPGVLALPKAYMFSSDVNFVISVSFLFAFVSFISFAMFNTFVEMKAYGCIKMWLPLLLGSLFGALVSSLYVSELEKEDKRKLFSKSFWENKY